MSAERLSRRKFLALSGAVAGSAALAACAAPASPAAPGAAESSDAPAAAGANLVAWLNIGFLPENTETEQPYRDVVLAHWNERYPDATIEFLNMGWDEELRQNLVTA